jgi:hypothetical protein
MCTSIPSQARESILNVDVEHLLFNFSTDLQRYRSKECAVDGGCHQIYYLSHMLQVRPLRDGRIGEGGAIESLRYGIDQFSPVQQ